MADALEEAQAKGIVHRGVEPANVMLTANGRVKIVGDGVPTHRFPD
jgi:serine/threonine protein kinase